MKANDSQPAQALQHIKVLDLSGFWQARGRHRRWVIWAPR